MTKDKHAVNDKRAEVDHRFDIEIKSGASECESMPISIACR